MTRDWSCDLIGGVLNRCAVCGESFYGHKRRVICYLCAKGED